MCAFWIQERSRQNFVETKAKLQAFFRSYPHKPFPGSASPEVLWHTYRPYSSPYPSDNLCIRNQYDHYAALIANALRFSGLIFVVISASLPTVYSKENLKNSYVQVLQRYDRVDVIVSFQLLQIQIPIINLQIDHVIFKDNTDIYFFFPHTDLALFVLTNQVSDT